MKRSGGFAAGLGSNCLMSCAAAVKKFTVRRGPSRVGHKIRSQFEDMNRQDRHCVLQSQSVQNCAVLAPLSPSEDAPSSGRNGLDATTPHIMLYCMYGVHSERLPLRRAHSSTCFSLWHPCSVGYGLRRPCRIDTDEVGVSYCEFHAIIIRPPVPIAIVACLAFSVQSFESGVAACSRDPDFMAEGRTVSP